MARFLSDEWFDELIEAGRAATRRGDIPADVHLVVEQTVVDDDGTPTSWTVRFAGGHLEVTRGPADDADVTIRQDRGTAAAIAAGELSAQAAFMDGRLRLGGDVRRLIEAHRALGDPPDVFAGVRAGAG